MAKPKFDSPAQSARRQRFRKIIARTQAARAELDAFIASPDEPEPALEIAAPRPRVRRVPVELPQIPSLREVVKAHIGLVMEQCQGNVSQAARVLGVERSTLQRRMAQERSRGQAA